MSKLDEYMKMVEAVAHTHKTLKESLDRAKPGALMIGNSVAAYVDGSCPHSPVRINRVAWGPEEVKALRDWLNSIWEDGP